MVDGPDERGDNEFATYHGTYTARRDPEEVGKGGASFPGRTD